MLISLDRLAPGEKSYAYDTYQLENIMNGGEKGPPPRFRRLSGLRLVTNEIPPTADHGASNFESPVDHLSSPRSPSPLQIVDGRAHNVYTFDIARAAHTVLRQGKRYLRPKDTVTSSIPCVEMRHHREVNNFIERKRRYALRRMRLYMLYRTVSDKLDGLPADRSRGLTCKILYGRLAVAMRPFTSGTTHLSQQDVENTLKRFAWRQDTWFPYTVACLYRKWLEKHYVGAHDDSATAYWFQGVSYKRQCCEAKT